MRKPSRIGVPAAIVAIVVTGGLGVAGATFRDDQTINADDGVEFMPNSVNIDVGDSVTWTFDNPNMPHNVVAKPDSPKPWTTGPAGATIATNHATVGPIAFTEEGTYTFRCDVHGAMDGTIVVGDGIDPTPTPTPTQTATPTPTPIPQPGGTNPTTPPPTPGADSVKPRVRSVSAKALRRAVRVKFRLSEPATVTVRVKRGRRVVKSKRVQAGAGTHTVTVRSKKLKKGRYTIEVLARDASGNRSRLATKRLTLRR